MEIHPAVAAKVLAVADLEAAAVWVVAAAED
jgi:hypothetical protein